MHECSRLGPLHSIEPTFVSGRKSHVFIPRRPTQDFQVAETSCPASVLYGARSRILLSAFTVSNLNDQGAGSLRQAILNADSSRGADVINFGVAGTITLASALPNITGNVNIDGTTAPGFAGTPAVEINFNNFGGLQFNAAAKGSALQSLALVDASGNGVTLTSVQDMLIVGNYIGLSSDGVTADAKPRQRWHRCWSIRRDSTIGEASRLEDPGNIISANGNPLQGILLVSISSNNVITNNYIGTDVTGTIDLGNGINGILVTQLSKGNLIGGEATGGNDPTNDVFVRPPEGNLISGNDANGVLINARATKNQLSGNFIGTAASGNSALGNGLNGVAIVQANDNSLIGCTFQDNPFVFYNVISGNGGNGLRVTNSNGTTIQANFFGMGADNNTAVGNTLNGVLVEGTSAHTVDGADRCPLEPTSMPPTGRTASSYPARPVSSRPTTRSAAWRLLATIRTSATARMACCSPQPEATS